MPDIDYTVHALRYAQSSGHLSSFFYRYDLSGKEDGPQDIDWYFWLIQGGGKTILVDCGFDEERGARKKRFQDSSPLVLLDRMGVRPEDVDHVIVSHAHYDHVGNIGMFPNARFSMARVEFDWMTGPYADRFPTCWAVDEEDRQFLLSLRRDGRLDMVDDSAEVLPGIEVLLVGGHTPGQTVTKVATPSGTIVLASDAAHLYEEFESDLAFNMFHNLEDMYRAYGTLRQLAQQVKTTVIPGHDPEVGRRYRQVHEHCFDLTATINEDTR